MTFELFAVIILAIVLAVVLKAYDNLSRELSRIKHEKEVIEERARHHAQKIVNEAKDKALGIVEGAQIKVEKSNEEVEERLNKVSEDQIGQYKQVLHNISKSIEDGALREMQEFKKTLEMETIDAQKIIGKRIEEQYTDATRNLEEYRLRKLKELNNSLFETLKLVSRKVLGRTMSVEDHGDLVVKALEEARHEQLI